MADTELNTLLQAIAANPALKDSFRKATTADEVAAIAKRQGYNIKGADIIRYQARKVSTLSDTELEAMAGRTGALLGANYTDPNSTRGCIC